ncbi:WGR domain-containing protein [Methylorubrum extorquens]|uniref:WGR domain-containing protein n=1 Tax=Methylorubrum extorquens TaxID=408 RepID=UPI00209D98F6|nr:WGR domain-containing protein [Methylorubrum extorquens]MCP1540031.1 putative DNA-binding WGR domain protein [Methylorubrum extorquens]
MTVYPIAIRKKSMLHRQGTKEYHQVLIVNGEGRAVLVQRWGKKNTTGQMKVETFERSEMAVTSFEMKDSEKRSHRGGYEHDAGRDNLIECANAAEFAKALGPHLRFNMGAANLLHVAPDLDVSGVKEPDPVPEFDRDGKVVRKGYQPKHVFKDFVDPAAPTVEEEVAANPNWGSW